MTFWTTAEIGVNTNSQKLSRRKKNTTTGSSNLTGIYKLLRSNFTEYPCELKCTDPKTKRIKMTYCTNFKNTNLLSWESLINVVLLYEADHK